MADSIILATSIIEGAEVLYTIDRNFLDIEQIEVKAPQMEIREWVKLYGTKKQEKYCIRNERSSETKRT